MDNDAMKPDVFCQVQWQANIEAMPTVRDAWEKWIEGQLSRANIAFSKVCCYPATLIATFYVPDSNVDKLGNIPDIARFITNQTGMNDYYEQYKTWDIPFFVPSPSIFVRKEKPVEVVVEPAVSGESDGQTEITTPASHKPARRGKVFKRRR